MFVADTHLHQCVFSGFYVPLLLKISDKSHPVPAQFSRLYWWDLSNRIGINLKIGILNLKNNNCYCSGWDLVLEIKSYVLLSILKHVSPFFMTQRQIVLMLNIRIILILVERLHVQQITFQAPSYLRYFICISSRNTSKSQFKLQRSTHLISVAQQEWKSRATFSIYRWNFLVISMVTIFDTNNRCQQGCSVETVSMATVTLLNHIMTKYDNVRDINSPGALQEMKVLRYIFFCWNSVIFVERHLSNVSSDQA